MANNEEVKKKHTTKEDLECIALKGIGQQLQELSYPRIENLNEMLVSLGYTVTSLFVKN